MELRSEFGGSTNLAKWSPRVWPERLAWLTERCLIGYWWTNQPFLILYYPVLGLACVNEDNPLRIG